MKGQGKHANKRRKLLESQLDESEAEGESFGRPDTIEGDNGLGGANWECIAITLQEYKSFLETIRRSRDVDEKVLLKRITMDALPVIEKRAEAQERKAAQKRRQLENVQKLSTAKRSSRIAGKMDKEREIREAEEAVRKRKEDLAMAHKEEAKKHQMEADRESRMMTREQRLKEREVKRILHEEELARLEKEDSQTTNSNAGEGRVSERQRKVEMEKRQRELEKLNQAGDDWDFNCSICGVHGKNLVINLDETKISSSCLQWFRMTALIAWHARSAMSGSTVLATVSKRQTPNGKTSTSYVLLAADQRSTQSRFG